MKACILSRCSVCPVRGNSVGRILRVAIVLLALPTALPAAPAAAVPTVTTAPVPGTMQGAPSPAAGSLDVSAAARFAALALKCLHQEYPSHISHTLNSA